ncbi:type II toxin-antitoxin system PemK/MazF family toxin [Coleofasciculus sp.]|uniref:type II toxin-antitoxin system PemK/MazF family toxin n=1 Tax=Coleofasciculus sp. TaxID=3100458 RepID=UPI003A1658DB
MVVKQGDIYWVDLGDPVGSAPGFLHPHVVIQNDAFNQSQIRTIVVCNCYWSLMNLMSGKIDLQAF